MRKLLAAAACLAAVLAQPVPALAQPLAIQESGPVRFVTGGVGEEERIAFDEARKDFNLELVFAEQGSGSYLSDVEVAVLDQAGREVLKTLAQGPRLLAHLPAGTYKVMATYDGAPQARNVSVPVRGTKTVAIYWKNPALAEAPRQAAPASRGASRPR